jgi:hypothetical protein
MMRMHTSPWPGSACCPRPASSTRLARLSKLTLHYQRPEARFSRVAIKPTLRALSVSPQKSAHHRRPIFGFTELHTANTVGIVVKIARCPAEAAIEPTTRIGVVVQASSLRAEQARSFAEISAQSILCRTRKWHADTTTESRTRRLRFRDRAESDGAYSS